MFFGAKIRRLLGEICTKRLFSRIPLPQLPGGRNHVRSRRLLDGKLTVSPPCYPAFCPCWQLCPTDRCLCSQWMDSCSRRAWLSCATWARLLVRRSLAQSIVCTVQYTYPSWRCSLRHPYVVYFKVCTHRKMFQQTRPVFPR